MIKSLRKYLINFQSNKEICEDILKKLKNENVQIEENKESKVSLYIAATNKIIIANIKDTFTRIQTIAHECLHSIQNRRILLFNFAFSNILLLYFIVALALILLNIGNSLIYILVFIFMSIIQYAVRSYLENEAMSKAIYVAKDYMLKSDGISKEDIGKIMAGYKTLNMIGISLVNYVLFCKVVIRIIVFCMIELILK